MAFISLKKRKILLNQIREVDFKKYIIVIRTEERDSPSLVCPHLLEISLASLPSFNIDTEHISLLRKPDRIILVYCWYMDMAADYTVVFFYPGNI